MDKTDIDNILEIKKSEYQTNLDLDKNLNINNSKNQNSPNNYLIFAKIGAALAIICILFLPVVGCGDQNLNGIELIKEKNIWSEVKFFIIASITCGIIIFFLKKHIMVAITAIGGIFSLIIAYLIAHDKSGSIDLKIGSYFAFLFYSITAIISFITPLEKKQINNPVLIQELERIDKTRIGIADEIKKLKELQDAGIITQKEIDIQKEKLLVS